MSRGFPALRAVCPLIRRVGRDRDVSRKKNVSATLLKLAM
jgi:hypothetical protein